MGNVEAEALLYTLAGIQKKVQAKKFISLHQSYGCPTLSVAYAGKLYSQNNWVTLHL